jgi:hypothetical protein
MIYNWTSVTSARYFDATAYGNPLIDAWPLLNRILRYGSNQGPTDCVFENMVHLPNNLDDVVLSVVQDFREAVGASFFDEAKDDPTLVPASCIVHIDAIVIYTIMLQHLFVDFSNTSLFVYLYETCKPAWKRATIYRREQAAYLKRWLVGDLFPDQEVPSASDGVPFYTLSDPIERSLQL